MNYFDYNYGQFEINEPVILELIESPALQRLKQIDQAGYQPLWHKPDVKNADQYNRFVHSLGVYLLLKKYGASIEEQIAGLIHDVSHSAFSHAIDYILEHGSQKEQSHQDNSHEGYVKKTEIPQILKKYGFDLEFILNDKNFPLKENNLPDLCADRIDYFLKSAILFEEMTTEENNQLLNDLVVEDNNWVFKNFDSAKKFADLFLKFNLEYWSGFSTARMFAAVGNFFREAISKEYLNEKDFYQDDKFVLNKITPFIATDEKLNKLWLRMNGKVEAVNNPTDFDQEVWCKSRIIDPLFYDNGRIIRYSDKNTDWKQILEKQLQPKQYFVKFID